MSKIRSFSIYGFTVFFNAAISFFTFSILTHHLNETDYGIINLYNAALIFIIPFIGMGVQYGLSVDYFKSSEQQYRRHFTNAMLIPLVMCVLITFIATVFSTSLQRLIGVNKWFLLLMPLAGLLTVFSDVILNLVRNKEKHYLFAGISVTRNILEISTTLLLVIMAGLAWQGRIGSSIITLGVMFLLGILLVKKWHLWSFSYNKKDISTIIHHGLPFVPERLAIFILGYSDRFFINHFNQTADVGYYGAGAQIATIVTMLILTLNNVFQPSLFRELAAPQINFNAVKRQSLIFIGLCLGTTLVVLMCIPLLFDLFIGETFRPGLVFAINLTAANALWGVYCLFLCFLLSKRKNRLIMFISISGMVLSLALNSVNVRYFGPIGATYTTLIVNGFMACITMYFVNKLYGLGNIFLNVNKIKAWKL
jgi:O-antigen/teichoic acid export membrane protein